MRGQKVLVTGYGGFLGSAITRQLLELGYSVRGLARGDYPDLRALGVETVSGSIGDAKMVRAAAEGCDAIIHTAAQAGVWGSWDSYFVPNTLGTKHLLEAAKATRIGAFVLTSSPSVTFDARDQSGIDESTPIPKRFLCHYPHTKALAEQMVLDAAKQGGIAGCALRPHLIWGNGDPHLMPRVVRRALEGRLRRVGPGTNLIDTVHVTNAARAHILALEKLFSGDDQVNGQAFFITDGQPIQCWDWISRILDAANVPVPRGRFSYRAAYSIGWALEVAYRLARKAAEPPMTRFVAAQLALDHYFSIEKARRLLDYHPSVDLEQALEDCKPWLRSIAEQAK